MGRDTAILTTCCKKITSSLSKSQSRIDTLPARLDFPLGQVVHETLPDDAENVPGSHLSQAIAPKAEATVPGSHLTQIEDPAAGENIPASHSEHADTDVDPSTAEDVPARHACLSIDPPVQ